MKSWVKRHPILSVLLIPLLLYLAYTAYFMSSHVTAFVLTDEIRGDETLSPLQKLKLLAGIEGQANDNLGHYSPFTRLLTLRLHGHSRAIIAQLKDRKASSLALLLAEYYKILPEMYRHNSDHEEMLLLRTKIMQSEFANGDYEALYQFNAIAELTQYLGISCKRDYIHNVCLKKAVYPYFDYYTNLSFKMRNEILAHVFESERRHSLIIEKSLLNSLAHFLKVKWNEKKISAEDYRSRVAALKAACVHIKKYYMSVPDNDLIGICNQQIVNLTELEN